MRQCGTHRLRHPVAFGVVTVGTKNTRQVGFGKLCGIRAASKDSGWCQLRQLRQLVPTQTAQAAGLAAVRSVAHLLNPGAAFC
jgi:hypothetical protein